MKNWFDTSSGLVRVRFHFGMMGFILAALMAQGQDLPGHNSAAETNATIPEEFRPLYKSLDETLRQDRQTYPFAKGQARPLVAGNLGMAWSMFDPAAPDSPRWKDLLATLDAFKSMKMDVVFVQIEAPDLARGVQGQRIEFYQRLAREIHSRNMKLYVEHFINVPFEPNLPSGAHADKGLPAVKDLKDDPQGRQEFLNILEQENALIYREIKPDFLTLIDEPRITINLMLHLTFSPDELANWVGEVTTHLKSTGASPNTLLGAGALIWEPEEIALKFAQQTNLDYVDIHLYYLTYKGEDLASKSATLVRKIREARPNMKITIGEAWLSKFGTAGPKMANSQELFLRDVYSFWSPLDEQFLALLLGLAQKENISVIAPSGSQYFFDYYTFGDAEVAHLPPGVGKRISASWDKAVESIRSHRLSSTGKALSGILHNDEK